MKKLFALMSCILILFTLASCGGNVCQHRDADDNSLCDKCGESYTDGKDVDDSTPCSHRDADDNSLCDKCGESYTDSKDITDEHTHDYTAKNTDSKYLDKAADCKNAAVYFYSCSCGEKGSNTFTYGSTTETHTIDDSGYCNVCNTPFGATKGIVYDFSEDGSYAEVVSYSGSSEKVIIAKDYRK